MYKLFSTLILLLLSACSTTSTIEERISTAEQTASLNNFEKRLVPAGDFVLTTYQRISDNHTPYAFYIEGDGSITSYQMISSNPTPSKIMLLKLAMLDTRPNVIYIARPCQYTPMELNPNCNKEYWTNKRLSEEVIESINIAINKISNNQPCHLVGFSGGGGAAVLVAARNNNVKDIITIAGNLDINKFSDHHKIYALNQSLNPIDYARKINNIPQLHISGSNDRIVPSNIAEVYVKQSDSTCVHSKIFHGITHTIGWDKIWQNVLAIKLTCTIENL